MGILSDPSLHRRNQLGRNLIKHKRKICLTFYVAALVWFCCLGHIEFNHGAYFSENALSPGLVYSEIKADSAKYAQGLLEELERERQVHKSTIPHVWIMNKMRQIGLETFLHNFTLNYPLGKGQQFEGKNIYGILRAPRIGSTEGIVLSTPYRAPSSVHPDITASVPILLAFAEFARTQSSEKVAFENCKIVAASSLKQFCNRSHTNHENCFRMWPLDACVGGNKREESFTEKNYWAKDIIFLVTDQEQLGMHAWLEAYYKETMDANPVLNAGYLPARAGALQAALNIEIQDFDIDYIDVKIEGLNGQLPNLDMFNLVQRLSGRENFPSSYKPLRKKRKASTVPTVKDNVFHMLSMVMSQANCVPTGNHGLFHRYRVESLTLEGVKKPSPNPQNGFMRVTFFLRTVEGIFRSLNNLLERFHQSYFFYLLVANDRFVSIGDFMPCLVLMAGPLFIKAFLLWLAMDDDEKKPEEQGSKKVESSKTRDMQYLSVGLIFLVAMSLGLAACFLPTNKLLNTTLASYGLKTEVIITTGLFAVAILGAVTPLFFKLNLNGRELLHIVALLHIGCCLILVGLLNFSLGFILAIVSTPLAITLDIRSGSTAKLLSVGYTVLLHPLVLSYGTVFVMALQSFTDISLQQVATKAFLATMDALTFAAVDSIIYENWLFTIGTAVFYPSWILYWVIVSSRIQEELYKLKEKEE